MTCEQAAGCTYHIADKENLTEAEWVERIAKAAGWKGQSVVLPDDRLPPHLKHDYDYAQDWSLDSSRLREELGYTEPTVSEVAMQRSVDWQRANPHRDSDNRTP